MVHIGVWHLCSHRCNAIVQEQLARDVQTASRKLCHRQLSWFRDERLFKWLEGDHPVGAIVDDIIAVYEAPVNPGAALRILMSDKKGHGHEQSWQFHWPHWQHETSIL